MKKHGVGIGEILVEFIILILFSYLDHACDSAINLQKKRNGKEKKNERAQYSSYGPSKLAQ